VSAETEEEVLLLNNARRKAALIISKEIDVRSNFIFVCKKGILKKE